MRWRSHRTSCSRAVSVNSNTALGRPFFSCHSMSRLCTDLTAQVTRTPINANRRSVAPVGAYHPRPGKFRLSPRRPIGKLSRLASAAASCCTSPGEVVHNNDASVRNKAVV